MKHILVVDDDIQLRPLIREILEREGYRVSVASNGIEALVAVQRERIDLMITDIVMPEKEGLETIVELRKMNTDIKIIAMSGGGRGDANTYLRMAKTCGADCTIGKPFDRREIIAAVESLLGTPAQV